MKNDTIVSCETAQWICAADATCSKALEYYHTYCQSMFLGKRCSFRCKNSIAILRKQEKAAKLDTCRCDGREEYDCPRIRANMAKLCFNKTIDVPQIIDVENNDVNQGNDLVKELSNDVDNSSVPASPLPSLLSIITLLATSGYFVC